MIKEKTPAIGDIRVAICEHTQKLVLQIFEGITDSEDDGWLCLHNDDAKADKLEVMEYIKSNYSN